MIVGIGNEDVLNSIKVENVGPIKIIHL